MDHHPAPADRLPASAFSVSVLELAAELGMSASGMKADADMRNMEMRLRAHPAHVHRVSCLRPEDAETLRAFHKKQRARLAEVPHWLSTAQAARALGLSLRGFQQRHTRGSLRGKLRYKQLYGPDCAGNTFRFHPEDVDREAKRIGVRSRSIPRGALSTPEVEALGDLGVRTITRWRAQGLPYSLDVSLEAYYWPAQVMAWLEEVLAKKHSRPAPAQRLLAALKAQADQPPLDRVG